MSKSLASEQENFAHIYDEHLPADPNRWIGSSTTRCSASRTRFSRPFRIFRGFYGSIFPTFFTIRASNIWSDDAVQLLLYTSWFGTQKILYGPPLRDVRTFVSLATEGTSTSASRSAVVPAWCVVARSHRRYFYYSVWYSALGNSSRIQFRCFSPSNSPLTLPFLVWITEYGTGQFCLNIVGQAVYCVWAPVSKHFNLDTCYWLVLWFRKCLKLYSVDLNISLRQKRGATWHAGVFLHIIFNESANIWNDRVRHF